MGNSTKDGKSPLKPVIREMVRTRHTPPNIVLLVDKIIVMRTTLSSEESAPKDAYRMYLTDDHKSIQAVFKRRMHKQVASLEIKKGSYISLKDYALTSGKRLSGKGSVQYLVITDFSWAGEEQRSQDLEEIECENFIAPERRVGSPLAVDRDYSERGQAQSGVDEIDNSKGLDLIFNKPDEVAARQETVAHPISIADHGESRNQPHEHSKSEDATEKSKDVPGSERSTRHESFDASPGSSDSMDKATTRHGGMSKKRKRTSSSSPGNDSVTPPHLPHSNDLSSAAPKAPKIGSHGASYFKRTINATSQSYKHLSPWTLKALEAGSPLQPITRPLKFSTLDSVTGIYRSRNKVVDILAIVESVDSSTTKPAQLPLKRDARLIDNSTERVVTLSIFVDPVNYIPPVGAIVLFRNLVTHEYRGGALNAYPHYCEGKDWCIPNPQVGRYPGLEKEAGLRLLLELQDKKKSMD